MFKVEAKKKEEGNYNVVATCPKGHDVYKKSGDTNSTYKCPHCGQTM